MFLDAGNDVLLKRYKETRRQHPLGGAGHIDRGIAKEREEIAFLKIRATFILDTSKMLTRELRVELEKIFVKGKDFKNLYITVMSFGFKYGIPQDADLVFDVRFLPNPYYIEELRAKTGNEAEVRDYVMKSDKAQEFFRQLSQMMDFLIPNYILEGRTSLLLQSGVQAENTVLLHLPTHCISTWKYGRITGFALNTEILRRMPSERENSRYTRCHFQEK